MTVVLALLQSTGLVFLFHTRQLDQPGQRRHLPAATFTAADVALIVLTLTAGTALIMWLGELITQRGIGNGMSILIFTSVISRLPQRGQRDPASRAARRSSSSILRHRPRDHRRGRVHRAGPAADPRPVREAGGGPAGCTGGSSTYIPLKVNQAGRHPDHLRVVGAVLPDAACQNVIHARVVPELREQLPHQPASLDVHGHLRPAGGVLRVLLHGHRVQPGGHRRQHPEVRRVHPRHPARAARRPSTSNASSPASRCPGALFLAVDRAAAVDRPRVLWTSSSSRSAARRS